MTDRTLVVEFGASKINVGLPGEGIPAKIWSSVEHGFLVSPTSSSSLSSWTSTSSSSSSSSSFSLRGGNNKERDEFLLLDLESCGLSSCNSDYSSSSLSSSSPLLSSSIHLKHNVFGSSSSDAMIEDTQVASQILRQILQATPFCGFTSSGDSLLEQQQQQPHQSKNIIFVAPDQIFSDDKVFDSWAQMIFGAGFSSFFPLRPSVAATIECGRPSAVILDCGHSAARINLVIDGIQRVVNPAFHAKSLTCSGRNLSKELEKELVEAAMTTQRNPNDHEENSAAIDVGASSKVYHHTDDNSNLSTSSRFDVDSFFGSYFPSANPLSSSALYNFSRSKIIQEVKHSCGYILNHNINNNHNNYQQDDENNNNNNNSRNNSFGVQEESEDDGNSNRTASTKKSNAAVIGGAPTKNQNNLHHLHHQQTSNNIKPAVYIAPSGAQLLLTGKARSACFERLFTYHDQRSGGNKEASASSSSSSAALQKPRDPNNSDISLIDLVLDCYESLPPEYRISLPLLCVGGTCRTEGFATRFAAELSRRNTIFQHAPPRFPQDPFSQWRGASFVAAAPAFESKGSWITKKKYEEYGVGRIRKSLP